MDPEAEKARQLVERIRRGMREVDHLLLSGAKTKATAAEIEENIRRMEELLRETESKAQSVLQGIDELIKMAKYQQSQQQQGGGGQDQPPKDQQQSQNPERQKTQQPEELQPQQQPGSEDQTQNNQKPDSPRPDHTSPQQQQADQQPPRGERGTFERVDTTGRWGILPPKEAEDLQRHNVEDFPQRYRPYMEMYYRRVNRLKRDR
jgi:succinate dehydrogenase flavin-adding protein (antitoxin of CptAB toxin-antitoxin module)